MFDFNKAIRTLPIKFVLNLEACGNRGDYGIVAYKPSAAMRRRGVTGRIEYHINSINKPTKYTAHVYVRIKHPSGQIVRLEHASVKEEEVFEAVKKALAQ